MTQSAPVTMTYAEYLAAEERSEVKHEFLRGHVYAMAGGTPEHAALAASTIQVLGAALRHKPCRIFTADLRVRIDATDLTTYPDVTVVCGELQRAAIDKHAIVNPVLLVEVLSDSTEAGDRGEKFAHYRHLESLREYLLVSHKSARLELYRKGADGHWTLFEAGAGETLSLESLGVRLETDEIYRDPLAPAAN